MDALNSKTDDSFEEFIKKKMDALNSKKTIKKVNLFDPKNFIKNDDSLNSKKTIKKVNSLDPEEIIKNDDSITQEERDYYLSLFRASKDAYAKDSFDEKLSEKDLFDRKLSEKDSFDRKLSDEKLSEEDSFDEKLSDEKLSDEKLSEKDLFDKKLSDEKLSEKDSSDKESDLSTKVGDPEFMQDWIDNLSVKAEKRSKRFKKFHRRFNSTDRKRWRRGVYKYFQRFENFFFNRNVFLEKKLEKLYYQELLESLLKERRQYLRSYKKELQFA